MDNDLKLLFNNAQKYCNYCRAAKTKAQSEFEFYRAQALDSLKSIAKWKVPLDIDEVRKKFLENARALATVAMIKCNFNCDEGVPKISNYLEEMLG